MLHSVRLQLVDKIRWPSVQFNNYHPFTYRTTMFVYAWLVLYQASYTTQSSTYSTFHMTIPTWFHPPCVSKNLLPFHNSASHITTFHIKKGQHMPPIKSLLSLYQSSRNSHIFWVTQNGLVCNVCGDDRFATEIWASSNLKHDLNEMMLSSEPGATI